MGLRGLLDESLCQMCINVIVLLTEVKSQHKAVGHQWRPQQEITELSHKTKKKSKPHRSQTRLTQIEEGYPPPI